MDKPAPTHQTKTPTKPEALSREERQKQLEFQKEAVEHLHSLYNYALHITMNPNDAEDLVQETYLKAYRFFNSFERGTNCKAWLFKILKNNYINRFRKNSKEPGKVDYDLIKDFYHSIKDTRRDSSEADTDYFHSLLHEEVYQALLSLPEEFREVIQLCDIEGAVITKAAGNMAYPMGLRSERIAKEILGIAKAHGLPFETVAGWGADPHTMIGAGARLGLPVLVSVPQLIGGGGVGLAIGDSISISERCMRMAQMIDSSSVLIESAIALTQEIHDGPFETYTGHGIWANWDGYPTTRLEDKTLIRIDLDSNLKRAWDMQRSDSTVQAAIDKGLPKTKLTGIPFRMEMSGFARLEGSLPLVGDIGVIWPIFAWKVSQSLGIELDFISHPQQTPEGKSMREWIVNSIQPFNRTEMIEHSRSYRRNQ